MRKIAYVGGPYTAKTKQKRDDNVNEACLIGRMLLARGYAPIVPHKNSYDWETDTRFEHNDFMEADLALLEHAHILVLMSDWTNSKGTQIEVEFARKNGIPIYSWDCVPDASEIQPDVTAQTIADLLSRRRLGVERYNRPLVANNGRNGLLDAYEEVLDLSQYIKQTLLEQSSNP